MSESAPPTKSRLETLDQLRGFFIVTIIVDHLSRFPSIFSILSGKALLWVTAAEGFVGISGLLVGYVRGYKNHHLPFKDVSLKLLRRAILLYVWSLLASVGYAAIIWYIPLQGGSPWIPIPKGDWAEYLAQIVTLRYSFTWTHFLVLYALFLAASPIAVWLFRHRLAWVVGILSSALLGIGWLTDSEASEALQWQFLFFIPSIAGFYLHTILDWWKRMQSKTRTILTVATISLTVITITMSVILTFYVQANPLTHQINDIFFAKDSISLLRAGTAFLWFTGYILIFYQLRYFIKKYFNWLLIPIGTHSLTAYILHGIAISIISFTTIAIGNFWLNSLFGAAAIMITWGLIKIPIVRKLVPS